jgi:hypothetical protein
MSTWLEQLCRCQFAFTQLDRLVSDIYLPQTHSWPLLPQQVDEATILNVD